MENIPITVRIPDKELRIIDSYLEENKLSRSNFFRNLIIETARDLEERKLRDKLINASKKVSKYSLEENIGFNETLDDGFKNV